MIIKEYDVGWGAEWPMKKLEQQLLKGLLVEYYNNDSRTVVINSVWYSGDYHQQVMEELQEIKPTHIFVIALLDPPIIKLEWFRDLNCNVVGIGYYPGPGFVDYFALFSNQFYIPVDQEVLLSPDKIDTAYMCLNRKPHQHRVRLYQGLENLNVLDHGFVSMGGTPVPLRTLSEDCDGQDLAPNGGPEQYGIGNDIASLGSINNWQRHFVNIVTETVWEVEDNNFISEKTFKPIVGLRPVLIYAPNSGIKCFTSRGFEHYINDFTDICDIDLTQPYNIPNFLKVLCDQDPSYWKMKFVQLKEKLLFNQNRFSTYVKEQSQKQFLL